MAEARRSFRANASKRESTATTTWRDLRIHNIPDRNTVKKMEAGDIVEILKKKIAVLSGGRDVDGRPIITILPLSDFCDVSFEDIANTLTYISSIPNDSQKQFLVLVDMREGAGKSLRMALHALQHTLCGRISKACLVKADGFFDKSKGNIDLRREKLNVDFELQFVHLSRLHRLVDPSHLTRDFGGSLSYNHDHWLHNRLAVENFIKESQAGVHHLDMTHIKMTDQMQASSLSHAEEALLQNRCLFSTAKEVSESVLKAGGEVLKQLDVDGDSGFRCIANGNNNIETKAAKVQVKKIMDDMLNQTQRLQNSWLEMERLLVQRIEYQTLVKGFQEVVEWIVGPAETLLMSQQQIGGSFQSADELRKQHEQLELKCIETYGLYAELRHRADAMIQLGHVSACEIQTQKEYMDTVCRSYAHRLERRRNLLITSAYFHRLVQEVFQKFRNMFDMLQEEWDVENPERCDQSLQAIVAVHENIAILAGKANHEGERFLDLLALPMKNASGKDVTPNFTTAIMHIKRLLAQLEERKKRSDEALEVRRLRLQQILQLYMCERDTEQATQWIEDLCRTLLTSHIQLGCNAADAAALRKTHQEFEETAKRSYDYGRQLLHAALLLRRSCKFSLDPNTGLGRCLHQAWRVFMSGSNERLHRLLICGKFHNDVTLSLERLAAARMRQPPYTYPTPKVWHTLIQDVVQAIRLGGTLLERVKRPVIASAVAEKFPTDQEAADQIKKLMSEAETKVSEIGMVRRDSNQSSITSTSSSIMESFKSATSTLVEDWKSVTSSLTEDFRTAASDLTSGEEWKSGDEYFSAEEMMSPGGNGRLGLELMKGADLASQISEVAESSSVVSKKSSVSSVSSVSSKSMTSDTQIATSGSGIVSTQPAATTTAWKEVSSSKEMSELQISKSSGAGSPVESTSIKHEAASESVRQKSDSSSIREESSYRSSTTMEESVTNGSFSAPLMTSSPLESLSSDGQSEEEAPLIRQMKEVGENVCEMLKTINLQ